ncbi:hypothetical protein [Atribacter laminatus]|jgi:ribosomal protein L23|uniref:Uncharacterized protein n=1 Tax=Atribacter laminatus TaxID=2847778 RepID=A0A7T1F3B4_ATRLM|nr:hypothetical protein [Atribacter laminatus]QPM68903.1 hypothetical protein RT761_02130 [Atribacter laminatus]
MQEFYETIKDILSDIKVFIKKTEDLKAEIIEQLIIDCPQKICLTVEEYAVQEEIKHYLSQLNGVSIEEINTIYRNNSFLQTMEIALGEKLGMLSDETFEWIVEIDSALGTFTSLPTDSALQNNSADEEYIFSDDNDITS